MTMCNKQSLRCSLAFASSLFVFEGFSFVNRWVAIPGRVTVVLFILHILSIVPIFFLTSLALNGFRWHPVTGGLGFLSFLILTSGEGQVHLHAFILGVIITVSILFGLNKKIGCFQEINISLIFLITGLSSLLAKGTLLVIDPFLNVIWAALLLLISAALLILDSRRSIFIHNRLLHRWTQCTICAGVIIFPFWGYLFPDDEMASLPRNDGFVADTINVVLVVIDTVRPEALEASALGDPFMPNLLRHSQNDIILPRLIVPSPSSLPTHASLFTGLPPKLHGAHPPDVLDENQDIYSYGLHDQFMTIAELFKQKGYTTIGISGNYGPLDPKYGLNQGFDVYRAHRNYAYRTVEKNLLYRSIPVRHLQTFHWFGYDAATPYRCSQTIVDETLEYLAQLKENPPFFLFVNLFDAHSPYLPPDYYALKNRHSGSEWIFNGEPVPEKFDRIVKMGHPIDQDELHYLWQLYRGQIRYLDFHLSRLLRAIDYTDTLIVVLSDHGESMGDHLLLKHANSVYQDEIEVPCVISLPEKKTEDLCLPSADQIRDVYDVRDLILACVHVAPKSRPAEPGLISENYSSQHPVYINNERYLFTGDTVSLIQSHWKLIWKTDGNHQLFNLAVDPDEMHDLAAIYPEKVIKMSRELTDYYASYQNLYAERPPDSSIQFKEDLEALRVLGYIQ